MSNRFVFVTLMALAMPCAWAQCAGPKSPPKPQSRTSRPTITPVRSSSWPLEGHGGSGVQLLGRKDVQEDLKLSPEQVAKIDPIYQQVQQEIKDNRSPQQGTPSTTTIRIPYTKIYGDANVQLLTILSKDQYSRLRAIHLQLSNVFAYYYPDIQDELALSVQQRTELGLLEKQRADEIRKWNEELKTGKITKEQRAADMKSEMRAFDTKVLGVITKDQQSKLESIEAPKFTFGKKK